MFKLSGNIRCASVESGRKLNLLWLKQKEHVLACDGNKILRVALVPGTAGLNSVSNIAEPGFSVYISQLLLVGSVVRQNLPKGHRRHFFHILPSSRLGQRVLLYFQSLIKSLVWRRCHAYLCISHFPRGKQWFDSGGWGPMFHTKNVVWVGAGALSKNRNSIKSTGDEFGAGGNTRCSYSSFEMMPLRQTSISYLCSVSHLQPLTNSYSRSGSSEGADFIRGDALIFPLLSNPQWCTPNLPDEIVANLLWSCFSHCLTLLPHPLL